MGSNAGEGFFSSFSFILHEKLREKTVDGPTRGCKKYLARFTKLTTAPSYIIIFNFFHYYFHRHILCNTSSVLTIFFAAEVIMKMIAFTPYGYWQSRRNRADMIVTILGVVWIIVDNIFKNNLTLVFGMYKNCFFLL